MVDAQEWLDENYSLEKRNQITKLDISREDLASSLNLTGFSNLIELNCLDNQLISLDLSDCASLTKLWCSNNRLINLNFLDQLNPTKLKNKSDEEE